MYYVDNLSMYFGRFGHSSAFFGQKIVDNTKCRANRPKVRIVRHKKQHILKFMFFEMSDDGKISQIQA
jgi:hypothetical protein